ncbi:hypothetical protein [Sporomusa termitida]|uniref:Uncharacterized protein n=1 Tax=Sporomusa termitida TaxID=2377 RepID=A0A517DPU5_9FIRM|nr:hypothetical protein [Sporomusa termitida]QDR79384.1 hypothetical protein SPTER_06580 [Sporomusa termitida]
MKIYSLTVLLIALLLTIFSAAALAAGQEFIIINASDSDLYDLSIMPANSTARGPDTLKGQELLSGRSIRAHFPNYDPRVLQWDIVGLTCCGEQLKWQQLDLKATHSITLRAGGLAELK